MKQNVVVGLDIGTSSLKVTLLDIISGSVISNYRVDYSSLNQCEENGVVHVSMYENTLIECLENIDKNHKILSLGLTTHMYSLCEETDRGILIHQWNSIWERDSSLEGMLQEYMKVSGCPVDTLYPAYKLAVATKMKGKKFLPYGLKEHLIKYLTGTLATDYTTASATGLMNIENREWNYDLMEKLGFRKEDMPRLFQHNRPIEDTKISRLQFLKDTVLTPGLGDGPSASYACESLSNICANIGTSMAARSIVNNIDNAYKDKPWIYSFDDSRYVMGGISSNGCSVLNWAVDNKFANDKDIECSKNGVMFFPWLHGERTPYWSSDLKGTFIGIGMNTNLETLNDAIIKGIAFTAARLIEIVGSNVGDENMVIIAGGGSHSKAMMKVLAGSLSMDMGILNDCDYLASHGAAKSASEAIGLKPKGNMKVDQVIKSTGIFREEYKQWIVTSEKLKRFYES